METPKEVSNSKLHGKVLRSQTHEVIANVSEFMRNEAKADKFIIDCGNSGDSSQGDTEVRGRKWPYAAVAIVTALLVTVRMLVLTFCQVSVKIFSATNAPHQTLPQLVLCYQLNYSNSEICFYVFKHCKERFHLISQNRTLITQITVAVADSACGKMFPKIGRELTCILSLSFSFMLLFAANYTMLNMQKIIVSSIADNRPGFAIEGYTVTGLIYTLFAVSLWFGPYINYALGAKLTMLLSALGYLCYIVSYVIEDEWAIYAGAVIVGIAAGTLWPAQGHYMIENSSPQTTARNVGIFLFIWDSSNMIGNLFVYFTFHGKKYINQPTRRMAVCFLVAINIVAILAFMVLPKPISSKNIKDYGPIKTLKKCWSLLTSRKMLWLTLTFSYAGLQQSFWNGIYSPSIGFTLAFGDSAKELVALSGIFMSIGALMGAICPIVLSGWIRSQRYARRLIVLAGSTAQLIAYLIVFINLPDSAVFGNTDEQSVIHPSVVLAMLCSLLLCFGDSCLATQIYSIIGDYYRENSAEACAIYKFMKGILAAVSFYWCNHLGLHTQLAIMGAMAVVGVTSFFIADHDNIAHPTDKENSTKVTSKDFEISATD